jgi:hypothetical protein
VLAAVGIFWSRSAITLAVLAFRRVNAARVLLAVSAAVSGVLGILAVPVGWLHAVAAFATVVLLLVGPSHRWFVRRPPPVGPFGGPFPGQGSQSGSQYGSEYGGQYGGEYGGQYGGPAPGWTPSPPSSRPPEEYPGEDPSHQAGHQPDQQDGGQRRPPSDKPPVW